MSLTDTRAGEALREAVEAAATILIASEPSPDGDAFGAELALRAMIEGALGLAEDEASARKGKGPKLVAILNERAVPPRYAFLESAGAARAPLPEDRERVFDLAVAVDGGVERMGADVRAIFERARAKAYIDHHRHGSRASYDVVVLDPERAATTELLAKLLDEPAWRDVPLKRPLAEALYVGLVSDTGAFLYSLTTADTHRVAARLLEAGVRASEIAERVLLELPFDDLRLKGRVLDRSRVLLGGRVVASDLLIDMLDGRDPLDVGYDRVVTSLAFVEGVRVTVLFRELGPGRWKISFRSRGEVDVASLARELDPQGGGHARAAGCLLEGELEDVRARTLGAVEQRLAEAGA